MRTISPWFALGELLQVIRGARAGSAEDVKPKRPDAKQTSKSLA